MICYSTGIPLLDCCNDSITARPHKENDICTRTSKKNQSKLTSSVNHLRTADFAVSCTRVADAGRLCREGFPGTCACKVKQIEPTSIRRRFRRSPPREAYLETISIRRKKEIGISFRTSCLSFFEKFRCQWLLSSVASTISRVAQSTNVAEPGSFPFPLELEIRQDVPGTAQRSVATSVYAAERRSRKKLSEIHGLRRNL